MDWVLREEIVEALRRTPRVRAVAAVFGLMPGEVEGIARQEKIQLEPDAPGRISQIGARGVWMGIDDALRLLPNAERVARLLHARVSAVRGVAERMEIPLIEPLKPGARKRLRIQVALRESADIDAIARQLQVSRNFVLNVAEREADLAAAPNKKGSLRPIVGRAPYSVSVRSQIRQMLRANVDPRDILFELDVARQEVLKVAASEGMGTSDLFASRVGVAASEKREVQQQERQQRSAKIADAVHCGATLGEIAEAFGVTKGCASFWVKQLGLKACRQPHVGLEDRNKKIAEAFSQGATAAEIAKTFDMSTGNASFLARKLGFTPQALEEKRQERRRDAIVDALSRGEKLANVVKTFAVSSSEITALVIAAQERAAERTASRQVRDTKIVDAVQCGATLGEIAEAFDLSRQNVSLLIKKEGLKACRQPRAGAEDREQEIVKAVSRGATLGEIAKAFNISYAASFYWVKKLGLKAVRSTLTKERLERQQKIADALCCGATYHEVGEAFGVTCQRIQQISARRGVQRPSRPSPSEEARIVQKCLGREDPVLVLLNEGLSVRETASRMKTKIAVVRACAQEAGIDLRTMSRKRVRNNKEMRDDLVVDALCCGATRGEVAEAFGFSKARVSQIKAKKGMPRSFPMGIDLERIDRNAKIIDAHCCGATHREVAEAFNLTPARVGQIVTANELKKATRKKSERLTRRDERIADALCCGATHREIADAFDLSLSRTHQLAQSIKKAALATAKAALG
jgi:DNA-binding NarL/FixJ family response regulator